MGYEEKAWLVGDMPVADAVDLVGLKVYFSVSDIVSKQAVDAALKQTEKVLKVPQNMLDQGLEEAFQGLERRN